MAVQPQTPYIEYIANGTATGFNLGFDCDDKDHLIVLVNDVEPVFGSWSLTGSAVVFGAAPTSGNKITIQRNTPFERKRDYQSYDNSFRPPAVNKGFDWIWFKLQELGVADWILGNRLDALKGYVDKKDDQLQENIDNLKGYVDLKDDELRAYLMEEIRKQGVALDQLDDYYNYLMERLAQIAVDKGWDASFVTTASSQNQQQINDFGGAKWYAKVGGYELGATVKLDNGDTVKSTISNNTVNPNVGMTGWFEPITEKIKQYNFPIISARDFGIKGDGSPGEQAKISEAYEYVNSIGGGTLYLHDGTYLIETVNYVDETPTAGVVGLQEQYAFSIYSNITVLGQSRENTIFKMADGIIYKDLNRANLGCALFADAHKGLHVKNFRLERFKVDMNGINNPVVNLPTTGISGVQQAIFPVLYYFDYYHSTNITVDNIWVHQNSGMNSIFIGHKSTQSVVKNCLFTDHSDYIEGNTLIKDHSTIYIAGLNNLVQNNMFVMGHDPVSTNERTKTSYISTAIEAHGVNTIVSGNIVDGYGAPFLASSTEWYNGDSILFANNKAYQAQIGLAYNSMNGQLRVQFIGNEVKLRKAKASTSDNSLRYAHAAVESMGAINSITDRSAAYSEIYVLNNVFEQEEPTDWNDTDKFINVCHNVKEAKLFVSKGNTFKNFKGAALHVLEHRNWLKAQILLDDNTYINCGQDKTYSLYRAAYVLKADPQATDQGFDYNLLDSVIASNETFIDCNYGVLVAKPNTLTAKTIDITGVKYLGSFIPPALIASPIDIVAGHTINIEYETTGFVSAGQTLGDFQGVSGKLKMNKWSSSNVNDNLLQSFEYIKTAYFPWNMRALRADAPSANGQVGAFPNKNGDRIDILTPSVGGFSGYVRFNNGWYGTGKIDAINLVT